MWQKLKAAYDYLEGHKTIIVARLYLFAGLTLQLHDYLAEQGFDIIPYLPPEVTHSQYWPLVITVTGLVFEGLRRVTKVPVP